ncbi:MAG: hypothetical protein GX410_11310 [Elusimicrobia bacterium]|nr:hypothetical protein [Elusimicrobiota bacterium]
MQPAQNNNPITLTLPCDGRYLGALALFVEQAVLARGFSDQDAKSAGLVVEETAANAVQHAYAPDEAGTFTVVLSFSSAALTISVKDMGLPITEAELLGHGRQSQEHLGMLLVENSMDEVHLLNNGKDGKEVRMVKYVTGGHIEQIPEQAQADIQPQTVQNLEIRQLREGEEIKLSRLLYNSYGYSYHNTNLYFPERIAAMHRRGELLPFVAAATDGQLLGHTALMDLRRDSTSAEMGAAAVDCRCRGQGISEKILDKIYATAPSLGLTGLYVEAVTSHTSSQKAAQKGGLRECALFMGLALSSDFRRIKTSVKERETLLLLFKYLRLPSAVRLFAPEKHKAMLAKLFQNIGVTAAFETPGIDAPAKKYEATILDAEYLEQDRCAAITVRRPAPDCHEQVKQLLRRLCLRKAESILLYLDLEDPRTPALSEALELEGAFFAGILPGRTFRNTLVLQYLNNLVLDYSAVNLHSPLASELMAYIRELDPNQR